ncbi:hypothetical protein QR685DRAFT_441238, partial [Neurospora intermedia]
LILNSRINTSIRIFPFFTIYKFNIELLITIIEKEARLGIPLLFTKKRTY